MLCGFLHYPDKRFIAMTNKLSLLKTLLIAFPHLLQGHFSTCLGKLLIHDVDLLSLATTNITAHDLRQLSLPQWRPSTHVVRVLGTGIGSGTTRRQAMIQQTICHTHLHDSKGTTLTYIPKSKHPSSQGQVTTKYTRATVPSSRHQ